MSRSVGLTAALGVKRVLASELPPLAVRPAACSSATPPNSHLPTSASISSGVGVAQGVLRPVEPSIYEFCLPRLAKEGFAFEESVERDAA